MSDGRNLVAELEAKLDHAKDKALRYEHTSGIYEKELELKAAEIERLRAVLQRCHSVLWFDLRNSLSFGPDYNQAVRDVALAVAEALEGKDGGTTMSDLVDRLRKPASHLRMVKGDDGYETAYCPRCQEAADEIERLKAALTKISHMVGSGPIARNIARTALEGKE